MPRHASAYDSFPDRPDPREQAALDWLARLDRGLTPEQEVEFERWLSANPQHGEAFGEFDGTWSLLNRLRETPEAAASARARDPDAFAPCRRFSPRVMGWSLPLLAAAALAIGIFTSRDTAPRPAGSVADFTLVEASGEAGTRTVDLPDGSIVQLNRDSSIDIRFTRQERRVRLARGEAHFTVAKDAARAFVVRASGVDVRAVGTAFNVRLEPAAVEVLVTEGRVRVNDEQGRSLLPEAPAREARSAPETPAATMGSRALVAGEKVTITLMPQAIAVPQPATPAVLASAEIGLHLAWRKHQLEFVSAPLAEMVAAFNRHNRPQIVIPDSTLAAQRFGGTFRSDDVDGFVRLLETHFGIEAERSTGKITLRRAR